MRRHMYTPFASEPASLHVDTCIRHLHLPYAYASQPSTHHVQRHLHLNPQATMYRERHKAQDTIYRYPQQNPTLDSTIDDKGSSHGRRMQRPSCRDTSMYHPHTTAESSSPKCRVRAKQGQLQEGSRHDLHHKSSYSTPFGSLLNF